MEIKIKSGTVIKGCNCQHEFQDKVYGKGMRVMNICNSGDKAKCTVCGTKH